LTEMRACHASKNEAGAKGRAGVRAVPAGSWRA
jgi:hypothetical protein